MSKLASKPFWLFIIIFFVSQLAGVIVPIVANIKLAGNAASAATTMAAALLVANVLGIVLFLLFRPASVTWDSTIAGLHGRKGRRSLLAVATAVPVVLLLNIIQELLPELPDLVGKTTFDGIARNPLGCLTISIVGPVCEELLFRGGIQTDLSKRYSHQGWFVPIAVTAAFFAIIHMNPAQLPVAFVMGLLLGFAYWWTDSLAAPVFIHIFNNSLACIAYFISPDDDSIIHQLGGLAGTAITVAACVLLLFLAFRAMRQEGFEKA